MRVVKMEPIEPGNPFLSDIYHMGVRLGTNCMVMMANHDNTVCKYLIIVDTTTGERVRIDIVPQTDSGENDSIIARLDAPSNRCSGKYPYHHGADETCPLCAPKK